MKRETFFSTGFITLGVLSFLLLFPVLVSGGPPEGKGSFLLQMVLFGAACLFCGLWLAAHKSGRPWPVLAASAFMAVPIGASFFRDFLRSGAKHGFLLLDLRPWILAFLISGVLLLFREKK